MLVIQQNYSKAYKYTIFALKARLSFKAQVVCI